MATARTVFRRIESSYSLAGGVVFFSESSQQRAQWPSPASNFGGASVELTITYTEPGVMGDSATGRTKPATLETGAEIQVPLFLTTGEKVKVDTRDGRYLGRIS